MQVTFIHGVLNLPVPDWQTNQVNRQNWAYGLTVPLLFGLLLALFVWTRTRPWHYTYPEPDRSQHGPPSDLNAAEVSGLDSHVDHQKGADMGRITPIINLCMAMASPSESPCSHRCFS
ncbi:MAG: hypothetical protein ACR2PG_18790 [Hyphomicrobiaceae bacterium]